MGDKVAIVVTSINEPGPPLQLLAQGCRKLGHQLIIIGDEASPETFQLEGSRFYGLPEQMELGFRFAELCPTKHYARKNIGYLLAIQGGATLIIDFDDDNVPYDSFWDQRNRRQAVPCITNGGYVNIYRYFSELKVWPRGFPLQHINDPIPVYEDILTADVDCPIQQGLTDIDPDVDAIFRLTQTLPLSFRSDRRVALRDESWCPTNSQNCAWWMDAFPLLYLPAYASFRMTDIWRSFVAQRIAWANNWGLLFHEPTAWQERNQHDLMSDFADELPGYLHNETICKGLGNIKLKAGRENVNDNMRLCYEELVRRSLLDGRELELLELWLEDLTGITAQIELKEGEVVNPRISS